MTQLFASFRLKAELHYGTKRFILRFQLKWVKKKAKPTVEIGTIAFWPMGSALCVFYGKSQPYSPVSILGKITSNLELFKQVKSGITVKVELLTS